MTKCGKDRKLKNPYNKKYNGHNIILVISGVKFSA